MGQLSAAKSLLQRVTTVFPVGDRKWRGRALAGMLAGAALFVSGAPIQEAQAAASLSQSLPTSATRWLPPEVAAQRAPFVELGVLDSHPGESKLDYMMRVAQVVHAFTDQTRYEACSAIMQKNDGSGWRVRLITNRSHIGCVRVVFNEPGYFATAETIHSHPRPKTMHPIYANLQDQVLRRYTCGEKVGIDDRDFSPNDMENGPGYLVARGKLMYQNKWKQVIGKIDKDAPIDTLSSVPYQSASVSTGAGHQVKITGAPASSAVWSRDDAEGLPKVACPIRNSSK